MAKIISAGILILILALGALLCKESWVKVYSFIVLVVGLIYQIFLKASEPLVFETLGFEINLYNFAPLNRIIGICFALFGLTVYLFIWSKDRTNLFYFTSLCHIGSAMAILFVGDLVSFFVFWELITLTVIGLLLMQNKFTDHSFKTYFIFQLCGAVFLLTGIGVNYSITNSMAIETIQGGRIFFLLAIMVKGGLFPFHFWLISTYPNFEKDLTILFSGYTTKVGVYSLLILLPGLDLQIFGGLIAFGAVLYALKQHEFRQLLAFHLISQMGYVISVINQQDVLGQWAGGFHLFNHILYKGLLFMLAATLIDSMGHDDLIKLRGRGRRKPILLILTIIASASIAGFPVFNGYISKLMIKKSLTQPLAKWLFTLAGIGTGLSFTKVIYYGFLAPQDAEPNWERDLRPIAKTKIYAMVLLAVICISLGLFPTIILSDKFQGINFYQLSNIWSGGGPIFLSVLLFVFGYKQINLVIVKLTEGLGKVNHVKRYLFDFAHFALQNLGGSHSGNLQHYLIWIFTAIAIYWIYIIL